MRSLLLAALLLPAARETVIHVSPSGDDTGDGSAGRPFATLARARDAARTAARPVTVRLRGGVHPLKETLVLGPADSDATWAAAPGESPVVSGGRMLSGWKQAGELWTLDLPEVKAGRWTFRQLFVDGWRRPRARTPDEGYFRIVKAGPDDRTSFSFKPGDLKAWSRLSDVEIVFLHDWSISRVAVGAVDEAAGVVSLKDPIGSSAKHYSISNFEKQPRYFAENALELLDRPGEWYLDRAEGRLHYKPLPGEEPGKVEAVAAVLERLVEVKGEPGKPVRGVAFSGIAFRHSEWPLPPLGYAEGQASQYDVRAGGVKVQGRVPVPPALRLEYAVDCRFERCRFGQFGGSGLWLARGCHRNRVTGCEFVDVAANGVMVGEGRADPDLVPQGNEITNSLIRGCGAVFHGAVGIWGGITDGLVVSRNEICELPYTGVSLGWVWNPTPGPCRNNRVEGNHIHHVMQILSDGGGIYTLGRQPGTTLRGNLIHDVPLNAGRAESNGIFMDEGTTDLVVEGNVIHSVAKAPIRFHKAGRNELRRNTLVTPAGKDPFVFNACKREAMVFEENQAPDPSSWKALSPKDLPAGRQE